MLLHKVFSCQKAHKNAIAIVERMVLSDHQGVYCKNLANKTSLISLKELNSKRSHDILCENQWFETYFDTKVEM